MLSSMSLAAVTEQVSTSIAAGHPHIVVSNRAGSNDQLSGVELTGRSEASQVTCESLDADLSSTMQHKHLLRQKCDQAAEEPALLDQLPDYASSADADCCCSGLESLVSIGQTPERAATTIQAAWRGWDIRDATSWMRGVFRRREVHSLRELGHSCAATIQTAWRLYFFRGPTTYAEAFEGWRRHMEMHHPDYYFDCLRPAVDKIAGAWIDLRERRLAPKVRAAVLVQAAIRRFLAGRRAAEMILREAQNYAACIIQDYAMLLLNRRRTAAVARLRVLLTEVSPLGHTDTYTQPAQRTSGPTGTEHLDTTDGSTRGRKAASNAARAKERRVQSSEISKLMSGIAMLKLRHGEAPATAKLAELLFPLIIPVEGFGASECAALAESISQRMALIEMNRQSDASVMLVAVIRELVFYDNLVRDAPGFTAAELAAESLDHFTGLARRLAVYLKKVAAHGGLLPIPTNNVVEDKYFQFADIVNTVGAECAAAAAARKAKAIAQLHNVAAQLGFSRGWDPQDPDADRWDELLGSSRACSRRSRGGRVAWGGFDCDDDDDDDDDDDEDDDSDSRRYI
jgi:hypothetical protein